MEQILELRFPLLSIEILPEGMGGFGVPKET